MEKLYSKDLSIKDVNKVVTLYGWVSKKRDLGGLIFIDLRDKYGIMQLALNPENKCYKIADSVKNKTIRGMETKMLANLTGAKFSVAGKILSAGDLVANYGEQIYNVATNSGDPTLAIMQQFGASPSDAQQIIKYVLESQT